MAERPPTKPSLGGYSGQSIDELIELAETYRVDSILAALEEALGQKAHRGDALSEPETLVLATEAFEREVYNGGFWAFFANSSSAFAPTIVRMLEAISCPVAANFAQQALDEYGITPEMIGNEIARSMEIIDPEEHDALDQAFYQTGLDIGADLFEYVEAHRTDIRIP